MKLVVGTDSTWSLRALICSFLAEVELSEHVIDLTAPGYKAEILKNSPTGLVPALITETTVIHDSLAIAEYFNDCTNGSLYPPSISQRATARSLCAELHSGFSNLRTQLPFTLDKVDKLSDYDDNINRELARVKTIFIQTELPFMFDSAGIVDAFYSILAFRLNIYGISLEGKAGDYQQALLDWDALKRAIEHAKYWKEKFSDE